ncbi:hypothetical protein NP493_860g02103 [Ridgeia piscesae]|uniref:Uncharacterized protein n=1 Tax=Ridgeia piscesae TaxID=27915 RepID=A0AAD9NKH6_RIDPI|nr:hypothetical protein NP493_860g02103 [Ridgeia piscesae]
MEQYAALSVQSELVQHPSGSARPRI